MKIDNRSAHEKPLADRTLDEQVNYWTGYLIVSIGKGNFRSGVCLMILHYLNSRKAAAK